MEKVILVTTFDNELLELMKEMRIEVSDIKNTTNRIDNKVEDNIRYLRNELDKLKINKNVVKLERLIILK
jgi:hypothetical protein